VSALGELSDGTPLLLCELWRELRDSGGLDVTEPVRLTRPLTELRGPERVAELVRQRLARLDAETVALLELAAVAGPQFELPVLTAAAGAEPAGLADALDDAVRSGLVEELPEPALAHRFAHELVRRAVYDRIAGMRRARLHLQVGEALERLHADDPVRVLPELAHHFALAAPVAGPGRAVDYNLRAAKAAEATAAYEAAIARLSRALAVGVADERQRVRAQLELAWLSAETDQATDSEAVLVDALETAERVADRDLVAHARVIRGWRGRQSLELGEMRATAEDAIATFTAFDDAPGLAQAWLLRACVHWRPGGWAAADLDLERALGYAEISGDPLIRSRVIASIVMSLCHGPTPVDRGIRRCEELRRESGGQAVVEAMIESGLSLLYAMAARDDDARESDRRAGAVLDQFDHHTQLWFRRRHAAEMLLLLGDVAEAERHLLAMWSRFGGVNAGAPGTGNATGTALFLAMLCCDRERWEDAERWLRATPPPRRDTPGLGLWFAARARLALHRGELAEAVALARRAVGIDERTDYLNRRADAWLSLAEVLRARGEVSEADSAVRAAVGLYEQKGNVAAAAALAAPWATAVPASRRRPSR
jgi:tetratricopeptide (TPR) repeat protein